MNEPRDVMAERFDRMEGQLRSYDVADGFITALADAGYVIVRESELDRLYFAARAAGSATPTGDDDG